MRRTRDLDRSSVKPTFCHPLAVLRLLTKKLGGVPINPDFRPANLPHVRMFQSSAGFVQVSSSHILRTMLMWLLLVTCLSVIQRRSKSWPNRQITPPRKSCDMYYRYKFDQSRAHGVLNTNEKKEKAITFMQSPTANSHPSNILPQLRIQIKPRRPICTRHIFHPQSCIPISVCHRSIF